MERGEAMKALGLWERGNCSRTTHRELGSGRKSEPAIVHADEERAVRVSLLEVHKG